MRYLISKIRRALSKTFKLSAISALLLAASIPLSATFANNNSNNNSASYSNKTSLTALVGFSFTVIDICGCKYSFKGVCSSIEAFKQFQRLYGFRFTEGFLCIMDFIPIRFKTSINCCRCSAEMIMGDCNIAREPKVTDTKVIPLQNKSAGRVLLWLEY